MNREEIYNKACEFADERINEGMLYDIRTEIRFAYERGAEWAQEQCDEEYLEVVQQKEELAKIMYENRASFDKERERAQAEIFELHDKLSVLTEQLEEILKLIQTLYINLKK